MSETKGRGRPKGRRKGEGNYCSHWREIEAKAAELGVAVNTVIEMAEIPFSVQNWRYGIPAAAKMFLALMSERSCTLEDLEASGITAPPGAKAIVAIRNLKPVTP